MWCRTRWRLRKFLDYHRWFLVAATCGILVCCRAVSANLSDECDWTGSGLTSHPSTTGSTTTTINRGVTPVYLRCTAGRVRWLYPRGALRVLLRLPTHQDREFRACIRLRPDIEHHRKQQTKQQRLLGRRRRRHRDHNRQQHGEEDTGDEERVDPVPARLFLEGPRSLLPLYASGDGAATKRSRCFNSKNGQAAIYVEAIPDDNFSKRIADFEYDLQALPRGAKGFDPTEECRPCTSNELAHAFCTSDLVTRGIIRGVENLDDLEISQMTIKVTKLIRHTSNPADDDDNDVADNIDLMDPTRANSKTDYFSYRTIDSSSNTLSFDIDSGADHHVVVHVAQHCGVTHGLGEFVFMARRKLGALTLQCAPRLEDWALLVHKMNDEESALCVLRS